MRTWLLHLWARLRTSFWFAPALGVAGAALLAYALLGLDRSAAPRIEAWLPSLREVSPDGVRALLSTAATSVLTLAGIAFSSTLVALTLASSQFGGRLLRNFIRSVTNQVTLAVLLGTFVYCLIVLRAVRGGDDGAFVPHIAALAAFVATLGSLAMFIAFVHHIATSLQADNIVARVFAELDEAVERRFPERASDGGAEGAEGANDAGQDEAERWEELDGEHEIGAPRSGYVQAVDREGLVADGAAEDISCRLLRRPGQFVPEGAPLLAVRAAAGPPPEPARDALARRVLIGPIRTAEQDFEFCLRQLVEVALRALSPGINDPFTAMNCIDFLGAALSKVGGRTFPDHRFADPDGNLRLSLPPLAFTDLLEAAFHQIRQAAGGRTDIAVRLLDVLSDLARQTPAGTRRDQVLAYAELVREQGAAAAGADCDRRAIEEAAADTHRRTQS